MNEGARLNGLNRLIIIPEEERVATLGMIGEDIRDLEAQHSTVLKESEPLRIQIEELNKQWDSQFGTRLGLISDQLRRLRYLRDDVDHSLYSYWVAQAKAARLEKERQIFDAVKPALIQRADALMHSENSMGIALGNIVKAALTNEEISGQGYSLLEPDLSKYRHKNNGDRILVGNRTAGAGVRLMLSMTGDFAVVYYPEDTKERGACIIQSDDIVNKAPIFVDEVTARTRITEILLGGDISMLIDGKRTVIPNPNAQTSK